MSHVSISEFRQRMASYFDRVAEDREPLVVTRQGGKGNDRCTIIQCRFHY